MRAVVRAVKDHRPEALVVASGYADAHRVGCVNPLALPDIAARSGADAAMLDTAVKDGSRCSTTFRRTSAPSSSGPPTPAVCSPPSRAASDRATSLR